MQKGTAIARKSMIPVNLVESSVPQQIVSRFGGAQVMLKPASPGTGIRASAAVRAVVQAAGVRDILTKSQGSSNPINVVQATLKGLQMMRDPREMASIRRVIRGEAPLPPIEKVDDEEDSKIVTDSIDNKDTEDLVISETNEQITDSDSTDVEVEPGDQSDETK